MRDRKTDRLTLLGKELRLAGVDLRRVLPQWARPKEIGDRILRELLLAIEAPIHEGLIPTSGSLIVPESARLSAVLPIEDTHLDLARKAADGSSALLAFRESSLAGLLLLSPSSTPDLQMARLAHDFDGVSVLRDRNGIVRLYGSMHAPFGSLQHAGRRWSVSPSITQAIGRIRQAAPMVDTERLFQLLELAHYVLSPWRIGATLVWFLSDRNPFDGVDLRPLRLSISPEAGEPTIAFAAHLLAQYDGATIISRDGRLLATNVHLFPTADAERLLPRLPGTRHTSALRASYDFSDTLIVTVSADGPVTVFSDGLNIFELGWFSVDEVAAGIGRIAEKRLGEDVWASAYDTVCSKCGKTSQVEVLTVTGWREDEEGYCRVCSEKIADAHCYQIFTSIKKVF